MADAAGQGGEAADGAAPPPVVIDTNCVLDVWLFADPSAAALRAALVGGQVRWYASGAMRAELARVLTYPQLARHLRHAGHAQEVLAAFDAWACALPAAASPVPPAPVRCRDVDDQMFIDLAVRHRATLISKDAHVLALARQLAPLGVAVRRAW